MTDQAPTVGRYPRLRDGRAPLPVRLGQSLASRRDLPGAAQIGIGAAAALVAVAIRYLLPLSPVQLPTLTVVVAVAITSTFVGLAAGVTAAVLGGLLSWYLFFTPMSWDLSPGGLIPVLGFSVIAAVIVTTSHLYRLSERRNQQAQLAAVQKQAEAAELFAREMAHRMKNALAIVQSIAFQTLGEDTAAAGKFAGRLRSLADAHDLLSEDVKRPTANVTDVVRAALQPFVDQDEQVDLELADVRIAAQQVVSLALAVHELGTNASKYGALSVAGGRVLLRIEDAADRVRLIWSEFGGPPVQQPETTGFGTKVLKRLGTESEFRFEPKGLRYSMCLRKN